MTSKEQAIAAAEAIASKKGLDVLVMDVLGLSSVTDYFVIASARSTTHLKTLGNEAEKQLWEKHQIKPHRKEGYGGMTGWILLDFEDFMVHLFINEDRMRFQLERLYPEAKEIARFIDENDSGDELSLEEAKTVYKEIRQEKK